MHAIRDAVVLTLLVGCTDSRFDEPERILNNSISFSDVVANKSALTALSAGKLDLNSAAGTTLLSTPEGRHVVSFVVGCALPKGQTRTGKDDVGVTYAFDGELGLSPQWISHAPSASDRRWVSACMLARVNNFGTAMKISLHGPTNGLYVNAHDSGTFTLEEGAFYGDIFTGADPII